MKNLFWALTLKFFKNFLLKDVIFEIKGLQFLPEGPFIVAANHDHAWDPTILMHILDKKRKIKIHFFTGNFLFRSPISRLFLKLMEQIPVETGNSALNDKAFRKARKYLARNEAIGIFPFPLGAIKMSLFLFPYKPIKRENKVYPGVIRLLEENPVPLVPIHVQVYQKHKTESFFDRNFKRVKITIRMPVKNIYFNKPIDKEKRKKISNKLMDLIYNLQDSKNEI